MRKKQQQKIGNSKNIRTSQYLYYYTQKHLNDGAMTLYNNENYVANIVKKGMLKNYVTNSVKKGTLKNYVANSVKKINNIYNN